MSAPIQGDKPLTLNNGNSQGTHSSSKGGNATAGANQTTPVEPPHASTEVDIERASQVYSSSTRQANASSESTITTAAEASSVLEQLKERLADNPAQAMQAQSGTSAEQVAALLHAA
ncbi:MAG: hypothetical protein L3J28_14305 [Candidatus Polarisedimenticolaceae bacterium]|nr:hypothetical protein [Candidatus Polarisedimenticolaceae bacterium]